MEDILEEIEDNPEYIILDKIELLRSVLCPTNSIKFECNGECGD